MQKLEIEDRKDLVEHIKQSQFKILSAWKWKQTVVHT